MNSDWLLLEGDNLDVQPGTPLVFSRSKYWDAVLVSPLRLLGARFMAASTNAKYTFARCKKKNVRTTYSIAEIQAMIDAAIAAPPRRGPR